MPTRIWPSGLLLSEWQLILKRFTKFHHNYNLTTNKITGLGFLTANFFLNFEDKHIVLM